MKKRSEMNPEEREGFERFLMHIHEKALERRRRRLVDEKANERESKRWNWKIYSNHIVKEKQ